ncbi:peptidoglycan DD-metalloendopeptidase family protein [Belliella marina]|uniref:Peptidoglycan DD-metalloendopeptidase family protein n=1 Tax=Belliella marina TaxID=1644146 RepID=A0ABW4VJE0_9BACT
MKARSLLQLLLLPTLLFSCNGTKIDKLLGSSSPYKDYENSLKKAGMEGYALGKDWIEAGENALSNPSSISLPYQEVTRFENAIPQAIFLEYSVTEGQEIEIIVEQVSQQSGKVFIDVFERKEENLKNIHFAKEGTSLTYQVSNSGVNGVRIQPELFHGGIIQIAVTYNASLTFPIEGKNHQSIGSFFGVARDGGARKHEGIDVFAPKGTPVVAVAEGRISRVGSNRLGGKTVSLSSGGYSYYFAHLDSQLVSIGQKIKPGDTLGLVGNTGNAVTTPPHLHFGIYKPGRGAVDPFPFLAKAKQLPEPNMGDSINLGTLHKIIVPKANLRQEPSTQSSAISQLPTNTVVIALAKTSDWFRVRLPDGMNGYLHQNLISPDLTSLATIALDNAITLKEGFLDGNSFPSNLIGKEAEVVGEFGSHRMLKSESGAFYWALD